MCWYFCYIIIHKVCLVFLLNYFRVCFEARPLPLLDSEEVLVLGYGLYSKSLRSSSNISLSDSSDLASEGTSVGGAASFELLDGTGTNICFRFFLLVLFVGLTTTVDDTFPVLVEGETIVGEDLCACKTLTTLLGACGAVLRIAAVILGFVSTVVILEVGVSGKNI